MQHVLSMVILCWNEILLQIKSPMDTAVIWQKIITDHDSPDGRTLKDRLINGSVEFRLAGENIATGHTSPIFAHHSLLNSPSHRVNVLNDNFNHLGVGIEYNSDNIPYYTENYIQK